MFIDTVRRETKHCTIIIGTDKKQKLMLTDNNGTLCVSCFTADQVLVVRPISDDTIGIDTEATGYF